MAIIGLDTDKKNPYEDDKFKEGVNYYVYDEATETYVLVDTKDSTPNFDLTYYIMVDGEYVEANLEPAWKKFLPKFLMYAPLYKNFLSTDEGKSYFEEYFGIANNKIFASIFGVDWKLAMSYCIRHYLELAAQADTIPVGSTLASIASVGSAPKGVLTGASVGAFSKSYDLTYTLDSSPEAMFWNSTESGAKLWALWKSKGNPTIFVVTAGPMVKKKNGGWW